MKLLFENWRKYLTEAGLPGSQNAMDQWKSMSPREKAEDIQQYLAYGQSMISNWEGYLELAMRRYAIFSKYGGDNMLDDLKELLERLRNLKDQKTKDKLINNIFSDGGSWVQVLELLKTL